MPLGGRRLARALVALAIGIGLAVLAVIWGPWRDRTSDAPGAAPTSLAADDAAEPTGEPVPRGASRADADARDARLVPASPTSGSLPPGTRVKIDAPVRIAHQSTARDDEPGAYRVSVSLRTMAECELVALELRGLAGVQVEPVADAQTSWHDLPAGAERQVELAARLPPEQDGGRIALVVRTRSAGRDLATAHSVRLGTVALPSVPVDRERGEVMLEATVE